ncbi:MAG: hypothetical protein ACREHG_01305, partial [Candidatus Saccharimonadales bacterium]
GQHFPGYIDEVRLSKVARSAAWIAAEYANQNSPSTFVTVGSAVETTLTITATGITSEEAFGTSTVVGGTVSLAAISISSEEVFGTPTISIILTLTPEGIASAESWGSPTVVGGTVTLNATGIASEEVFGSASISGVFLTIAASSISTSDELWGKAGLDIAPNAPRDIMSYLRRNLHDPSTAFGANNTAGTEDMPANYNQVKEIFDISATETFVTLSATPSTTGFVTMVFKNGALLEGGTGKDYTIDSAGTKFTFTTSLVSGDVVEIVYWTPAST